MMFPVGREQAWRSLTEGDLTRASQPWGPIPGVVAIHDEPPSFFTEPGLSRRLENSDGSTMIETTTAIDPPDRFAYTITELTNSFRHLTPGAHASFTFEPVDDSASRVTWRYAWDAHSAAARPLVWLIVHIAFVPYMRRMLRGIARHAQ